MPSDNLKETVDKIFGYKYGGYFDPANTKDPDILELCINACQAHIDYIRRDDPALPKVNIAFLNHGAIGAAAAKFQGEYYIGLTIGTFEVLLQTFLRLLSSPKVLTAFGNSKLEFQPPKLYNPIIYDLQTLGNASHPESLPIPKDANRVSLATHLLRDAFIFLISHEYGHIVFGHCDYVNSKGASHLSEKEANGLDAFFSQTLEFNADCYAASVSFKSIQTLCRNRERLNSSLRPFYKDLSTAMTIWFFAIEALFRLFGHDVPTIEDLKKDSHPPASIRANIVSGTIFSYVLQDAEFTEKLKKIATDTIRDVEAAFQEISETQLDKGSLLFSMEPESHEHVKLISRNWNNVRPLLAPFAHTTLPPLYYD